MLVVERSTLGTTGEHIVTPALCLMDRLSYTRLWIQWVESFLVQKTITAMPPKHDLMSEIVEELILCHKNVIWKLLLLNNCRLLIYWIYVTNPEPTFILKTKLRTKTACVKPNHFKHSCRCLHNVHFWKETTKAGEIKRPLNYFIQWKFLAKHIFSFHFVVQHICPWGKSHSWLRNEQ